MDSRLTREKQHVPIDSRIRRTIRRFPHHQCGQSRGRLPEVDECRPSHHLGYADHWRERYNVGGVKLALNSLYCDACGPGDATRDMPERWQNIYGFTVVVCEPPRYEKEGEMLREAGGEIGVDPV